MGKYPFTHITIQPADDNGAHEIWGQKTVTAPGLGTFDTDGIIGHLYRLRAHWIFLNEQGHPTMVFSDIQELAGWLQSKAPIIDWAETYRQPDERGACHADTEEDGV